MPSIRIWTPESDFDSQAVCCIAEKIIDYYKSDFQIFSSSKKAFNKAVKQGEKGLENQVNFYLKTSKLVIFLLDADGVQANANVKKNRTL